MAFPPPTERQAKVIWLALTGLAVAALVGLLAGLVWGVGRILQLLSPVLWPLAFAGVLAYLLDPLVDLLERRGASRVVSIIAVFGVALLLATAFFASIVPQLVNEATNLVDRIPTYASRLETKAEGWLNHPPALLQKVLERDLGLAPEPRPADPNVTSNTVPPALVPPALSGTSTNLASGFAVRLNQEDWQTAATWLANALKRAGVWLFGHVGVWLTALASLALVPVYTFYFLLEKRGISAGWTNYLPVADSRFKEELVFVLSSINNYLIVFFRGQVLVALCDGALYAAGFLLVGLPYAVLIGAMAVVLTMIPFLGAMITCATALLIALVQFGDWQHPLGVALVFGVVQALEGVVISPKIMGGRVGLHPVTIIIAVVAGTALLGGLLGGLLAIPLTAALRVLMFRYVWKSRN